MINSAQDIYNVVDHIIEESSKSGNVDLATELESALQLGSSGLEILGAVRSIFVNRSDELQSYVDRDLLAEIVEYIRAAYTSRW